MTGPHLGPFLFIFMFYSLVHARHLDLQRELSNCEDGQIPWAIKNEDGFLKLTCVIPRCEDIKKYKAVCTAAFSSGCPKGSWVGGLHREMGGENEKTIYKTKCCSHPIFEHTVAIKPHEDFKPDDEAKDASVGQGDTIDIVTNVHPSQQFDHHNVEITTIYCGKTSSTSRTTAKPQPTQKPNNNNGGQAGAVGGKNGGEKGGKSGGHNGDNGGDCGVTGCHNNPPLEGGSPEHYQKQNVPLPGKPPASASDPKAWGIDNSPRGAGGAGCFSADTIVHTPHGEKRMDQLRVGDHVLSTASWDGNSAISYQPITQFIHNDPLVVAGYTVISTVSGRSLSLTPYHLLPQFECHHLHHQSISVRQYELLFNQWARFAKRARPGQCVLMVNSEGHFSAERISNVTRTVGRGVFSPITSSGIIVTNGFQASCYSSVENHAIQHTFFTCVTKINRAWKPYLDMVKRIWYGPETQTNNDGQIPLLLRIMLILSELVISSF